MGKCSKENDLKMGYSKNIKLGNLAGTIINLIN